MSIANVVGLLEKMLAAETTCLEYRSVVQEDEILPENKMVWRLCNARYGISNAEKVSATVSYCKDVMHYAPDCVMSKSIAHVWARRWFRERVFIARCNGDYVEPSPE